MALKKRSKVSAEFNMSSLTDIIFLLLIFFMLTSTVVAPNALNLKLPGRADTPASPSTERLDEVRIDAEGSFFFNDRRITSEELEAQLQPRGGRGYSMLIAPDRDAPVEGVVTVMDLAMRLDINGVLAAEE
ncbi:biopolymer transport protein ExbD [Lewinella marina]|uniref:Biopolymer transporter ExbD n=1 Tax=Neolewinella marina TaxID=438751 RepID=A0A2G0CI90_9BACT|nr:biopolymer transporter ExbD [Neolewinella marina]NJB85172.1 biopolymer transport protein ExbD [Neolewinella marina]PHK99695.1 biopolymer transporter ExbD [Neolewinella marina]